MKETIGFVFISGAGLERWIWDGVTADLHIPNVVIDYPKRHQPKESVKLTFEAYVDSALEQITSLKTDKVILVGHSIGGVVMMRLGELLGARVAGYVAVGAVVPRPNESYLDCFPQPQRFVLTTVMKLFGTNVPQAAIRKGLCNGLDEQTSNRIVGDFTPESYALYATPVEFSDNDKPRLYIVPQDDANFSVSFLHEMAERLHGKTIEVPGGHLAMISHAPEIASTLNRFISSL